MRSINTKTIVLIVMVASVTLLSGCCTNWKQKYENANVLNENLKGQLEYERQRSGQLEQENASSAQTIAELQKQIAEGKSGLEGLDVSVDPAKGTITVTLQNAILFDSGKETLKQGSIKELDQVCSVINSKYAGKQIAVVGHTDSDPIKKSSWEDNWELSAQRALSVLRYLVKKGIPDEQIEAVGCGEAKPVASNSTASGKAQNRRVEIVVYTRS